MRAPLPEEGVEDGEDLAGGGHVRGAVRHQALEVGADLAEVALHKHVPDLLFQRRVPLAAVQLGGGSSIGFFGRKSARISTPKLAQSAI